ncbi:hypothetical protein H6784_04145 [Candidatus Nomurabacteria bacterium]|nr:hypothetical protein [Candidatus Kaiserbacteria bacterium]MCB9814578.1 hypothetical protein [Candidatus Nomurabacteria bacterium]
MTNTQSVSELWGVFEHAVTEARAGLTNNKPVATALSNLFATFGNKQDFAHQTSISIATIDRWLGAYTLPTKGNVINLKNYFFVDSITDEPGVTCKELVSLAFLPLVEVIAECYQTSRNPLPTDNLAELIVLIRKSKGKITKEMIKAFLGLQ